METLMSAVAPRSPAPVKRPSEVDFRSGASLEQLSAQVTELVHQEQGEFGDQTALEVHTAKDFIFNMLAGETSLNKTNRTGREQLFGSGLNRSDRRPSPEA
ncbi:hypothetical protein WMY93_014079 [Mugilogobius chulae]|uniref:Uncharacterized protein n=1 Tax=Mugilogobius chulae TaxID=88201 RepID=A0AAW0P5L2_9GOBI